MLDLLAYLLTPLVALMQILLFFIVTLCVGTFAMAGCRLMRTYHVNVVEKKGVKIPIYQAVRLKKWKVKLLEVLAQFMIAASSTCLLLLILYVILDTISAIFFGAPASTTPLVYGSSHV